MLPCLLAQVDLNPARLPHRFNHSHNHPELNPPNLRAQPQPPTPNPGVFSSQPKRFLIPKGDNPIDLLPHRLNNSHSHPDLPSPNQSSTSASPSQTRGFLLPTQDIPPNPTAFLHRLNNLSNHPSNHGLTTSNHPKPNPKFNLRASLSQPRGFLSTKELPPLNPSTLPYRLNYSCNHPELPLPEINLRDSPSQPHHFLFPAPELPLPTPELPQPQSSLS